MVDASGSPLWPKRDQDIVKATSTSLGPMSPREEGIREMSQAEKYFGLDAIMRATEFCVDRDPIAEGYRCL